MSRAEFIRWNYNMWNHRVSARGCRNAFTARHSREEAHIFQSKSRRGKKDLRLFIIPMQRSFLTLTRENALKGGQRRIYPRNSILHRHAELGVSGKNSLRRPPQSHPPRQNWQSWWSWSRQTGWCLPYIEFLEETSPPTSAYLDRCAVSALRQKLASYTGVRDVSLELLHFSRSSLVIV